MKKEIYNHRTIEHKDVTINGKQMAVRRVYFFDKDKYSGRDRTLVEVQVYDYTDGNNYSEFMNLSEWHHLCRCHWVNVKED